MTKSLFPQTSHNNLANCFYLNQQLKIEVEDGEGSGEMSGEKDEEEELEGEEGKKEGVEKE